MSETKQKNKIDPCIWLDDAPDKHEGGWRNVYFSKCGLSHTGSLVHATEEAAANSAKEPLTKWGRTMLPSHWADPNSHVRWTETTHAIQIPVKEKP